MNLPYSYTITKEGNVINIILSKDSLKKVFTIHGANLTDVRHHMESLTDQQCADYFKGMK